MNSLSDGSFYLTYQDDDKLKDKITKPVYLGSFILGYSRRIMLDYLKKSNPYFDSVDLDKQLEHSPYYTDTDSIQIHQRNLKDITLNNQIGRISDDLGDNCKILSGGWIAPKLYFLEYVERSGEIKYHFRGKGIPKDKLNIEMFEQMMSGESVTRSLVYSIIGQSLLFQYSNCLFLNYAQYSHESILPHQIALGVQECFDGAMIG